MYLSTTSEKTRRRSPTTSNSRSSWRFSTVAASLAKLYKRAGKKSGKRPRKEDAMRNRFEQYTHGP